MSDWRQYYHRACGAMDLQRWEIAHEQILLALSAEPDEWLLHVTLAEICYHQTRYEEARHAAKEAISRNPDHGLGYFWLAWSLISDVLAGPYRLPEASQIADRALECSPQNADFLYLRAIAAHVSGHSQTAESFARAGLQADPEHLGCLEILALLQSDTHADHEAEATLRQMLHLQPESGYLAIHLCLLFGNLGKNDLCPECQKGGRDQTPIKKGLCVVCWSGG